MTEDDRFTITWYAELSPDLTHVTYSASLKRCSPFRAIGPTQYVWTTYRGQALVGSTGASILPGSEAPEQSGTNWFSKAIFAAEQRRRAEAHG